MCRPRISTLTRMDRAGRQSHFSLAPSQNPIDQQVQSYRAREFRLWA
jgi:hypothetical protein